MQSKFLTILILIFSVASYAQEDEKVYQTFKDTRVINAHSVETLKAGILDFRIGHRFGDFLGDGGGWETFYGLEEAEDVMFGFEYGLSDRWMIGINRAKGAGLLKRNINLLTKYRIADQDKGPGLPFSIAVLGVGSISSMEKSNLRQELHFFEKFAHRLSYHGEVLLSRKFNPYISLQISGAWTYRNIVPAGDQNDLASVGFASRIQVTKAIGVILDARYVFSDFRSSDNGYYTPLGIGLEWETGGGHVFQINFTNAKGIEQTDYIPYTTSNWSDGGFRLGFTIARQFRI